MTTRIVRTPWYDSWSVWLFSRLLQRGLLDAGLGILLVCPCLFIPAQASGDSAVRRVRIKDVATIEGVRDNQLIGYGIVVGLNGTGDSQQTIFPVQTLISTLQRMGVNVPTTGSSSTLRVQNM